jgi:hypothetical protein
MQIQPAGAVPTASQQMAAVIEARLTRVGGGPSVGAALANVEAATNAAAQALTAVSSGVDVTA